MSTRKQLLFNTYSIFKCVAKGKRAKHRCTVMDGQRSRERAGVYKAVNLMTGGCWEVPSSINTWLLPCSPINLLTRWSEQRIINDDGPGAAINKVSLLFMGCSEHDSREQQSVLSSPGLNANSWHTCARGSPRPCSSREEYDFPLV